LKTHFRADLPTPPHSGFADSLEEDLFEDQLESDEVGVENSTVQRSITISGLSPATTLKDLAKVIRGGTLFELYIRNREMTGHVSFVEPSDAQRFLEYAQSNTIYIRGNQVSPVPLFRR
jgi:hypothetical protein